MTNDDKGSMMTDKFLDGLAAADAMKVGRLLVGNADRVSLLHEVFTSGSQGRHQSWTLRPRCDDGFVVGLELVAYMNSGDLGVVLTRLAEFADVTAHTTRSGATVWLVVTGQVGGVTFRVSFLP
jgi:hypothetical protein